MKTFLIVVGVLAALILIGRSLPAPGDSPAVLAKPNLGTMTTTATEMAALYATNEASAQARFSQEKIKITGTVNKISLNLSGTTVVSLDAGNTTVSARLDEYAKGWGNGLQPGMGVTMLCDDPYYIMGIPTLGDCIAQAYEGATAPTVTHHHRNHHHRS